MNKFFSQNKLLVLTILLLSVAGSVKTISRSAVWKNQYVIYATDVKNAPNDARLHYWYANETLRRAQATMAAQSEKVRLIDEAIREYDRALQIYPDYADAFGQRGLAYSNRGDKQLAEADYKRAIDLKTGQWEVFNNLGVVYGEQSNFEEAMKCFKFALQLETRFPDPYKNIASIYFFRGDYDNAINQYLEALKHVTAADRDLIVEAYDHLSRSYQQKGDPANQQKYAALARESAAAR